MKTSLLTLFTLLLVFVATTTDSLAQQVPNARMSPTMISATTVDGGYIKVVYGMPSKRDRVVFGGLVPYGSVWRTGADEATEITLTKNVVFHNTEIPAGHYSLFTIPTETEWTIIFNRELGLWGAFNYKEEHDVARFTVPVETLEEEWEAFRILIVNQEGNTSLQMKWDRTGVTIPFQIKS
jgi:hypothetical protein